MVFLKTDQGGVLELAIPSTHYVGRGSNSDIKPDSKSVSKRHGKITIERNAATGEVEAWLEDYNSTFGTYVGETPAALEKITEKTRLRDGFYIRFGHAPACFQYIEPIEEETSDPVQVKETHSAPSVSNDADHERRESRRPPPIIASPYKLTDEELALQLQFGQADGSPSAQQHRTRELIMQFEAQAKAKAAGGGSPKHQTVSPSKRSATPPEPSPHGSDVVAFSEGTSMRDMAPAGSFMLENSRMSLRRPLESFTDSIWEESRTALPTPTTYVASSSAKSPRACKDSEYGGFTYDLDEKPGADEVSFTSQSLSQKGASAKHAGMGSTKASPRAASVAPSTAPSVSPRNLPVGPTIAAPPAAVSHTKVAATPTTARGDVTPPPPPPGLSEGELQYQARNMLIARARHAFVREKAALLQEASLQFNTYRAVARQWRKATLALDSIAGGFCISVVLPFLDRVKVKPTGRDKHKVRIDAHRFVDPKDKIATDANSEYLAEFKLRGLTSEIRPEDLSYEYDMVTGLLCVFVNRLRLKNDQVLVKRWSIPLLLKGRYVPSKSGNSGGTPSTNDPATSSSPTVVPASLGRGSGRFQYPEKEKKPSALKSVLSWIPGVGVNDILEAEAHEHNAKSYQRVLSRKQSMRSEGMLDFDMAGADQWYPSGQGAAALESGSSRGSSPRSVHTGSDVLRI